MVTNVAPPAQHGLQRTRQALVSAGPVILAFLASQHHTVHMLLLTFGLGTAGISFLTMYPSIRRGMLAISLAVAAVLVYRATRPGRSRAMRVTQGLSVLTTLLLIGWSVGEFGL